MVLWAFSKWLLVSEALCKLFTRDGEIGYKVSWAKGVWLFLSQGFCPSIVFFNMDCVSIYTWQTHTV